MYVPDPSWKTDDSTATLSAEERYEYGWCDDEDD